ncbi:hypothetical protein [Fictibacillus barbaricus]|uniref:Uncharacterized protein n=1 Tax=Fictibacillus barbaricus TaxID=182136 RepID=A0ABS2ZC11_9BACL|nr:hypothetical protein [Fictibacillus barbaricus]MBN3544817.1 hypothetical protein [Fictibacillus barbaricus]GGB63837.1 hypothetical protein GCM10007199_32360 [Fictibacillus barbaricus]
MAMISSNGKWGAFTRKRTIGHFLLLLVGMTGSMQPAKKNIDGKVSFAVFETVQSVAAPTDQIRPEKYVY